MKTYEIFTTEDSKIVQAKNICSAIGKYGLIENNLDKEVIAIIEHGRGHEFITGENNEAFKCAKCKDTGIYFFSDRVPEKCERGFAQYAK